MAVAELGPVVLDCPDPHALARFYAGVLGGTVEDRSDDQDEWVDLNLPGGRTLAFQGSPGHVPPKWPGDDGAQQFHLDLDVKDLDAAEKTVLELGARPLDAEDRTRTFRVYADPAGHPFCLCAC
ncbi:MULTISPECIES: VOC family protein [Streptomyces]|uniref:Glyoxalase n=1 Tax=Streptomyces parvulus TaxID=146923 RepID=A0A191UYX8_9ACTN|nr:MULTISPECIES: VOC family protein [Streptomyces]ANJ07870.1 glyoxalase [Streptomyces parvulus]MCQ4194419.1 VOC family protein [Streptomyces parvulus]WHM32599.1 VOC family protein [Streptomyces sp. BPPL-273]WML80758.1 VOC family protein [Streptomyces sp. VNUA74]GGR78172.1 glyoxalase [Streptomyces parvulus]